jgi:nucleotide-binding universal stress UspA family protein
MSAGVVVGVSPTSGSPAALRWAAEEARTHALPLHAVMAWRNPRPPVATGTRPPMTGALRGDELAAEAQETLRGFVELALGKDVDVECSVVRGTAVNALVTAARDAALLVIGEPRTGTIDRVRASLVAPQVVLKAHCPVVVMPASAALMG